MTVPEVLIGVVVALGVLGVLVPVLPGGLLILGAVLVWAVRDSSPTAWTIFAIVTVVLVAGSVVKYAVPGRGLRAAGVPNRTLVLGGLLGLIGFFVIPVVGLLIGFVLGVYLAETLRVGRDRAWPSTKQALRAAGLSVLIELVAAMIAASTYVVGAVLT